MADEVQFTIMVDGPPHAAMEHWRVDPPAPFGDYELEDQSYASLSYVRRYLDWPQKLLIVLTLGFALLFKAFMTSTFRLTVRFDEAGVQTRVTVLGTAHPSEREELAALAAVNGGAVGLAVGV